MSNNFWITIFNSTNGSTFIDNDSNTHDFDISYSYIKSSIKKKEFKSPLNELLYKNKDINNDYINRIIKNRHYITIYRYKKTNKDIIINSICIGYYVKGLIGNNMKSFHIDIIFSNNQGSKLLKFIEKFSSYKFIRYNFITLESLDKPIGFYLKQGYIPINNTIFKSLKFGFNAKSIKKKKIMTPINPFNSNTQLHWSNSKRKTSKKAWNTLLTMISNNNSKKKTQYNTLHSKKKMFISISPEGKYPKLIFFKLLNKGSLISSNLNNSNLNNSNNLDNETNSCVTNVCNFVKSISRFIGIN